MQIQELDDAAHSGDANRVRRAIDDALYYGLEERICREAWLLFLACQFVVKLQRKLSTTVLRSWRKMVAKPALNSKSHEQNRNNCYTPVYRSVFSEQVLKPGQHQSCSGVFSSETKEVRFDRSSHSALAAPIPEQEEHYSFLEQVFKPIQQRVDEELKSGGLPWWSGASRSEVDTRGNVSSPTIHTDIFGIPCRTSDLQNSSSGFMGPPPTGTYKDFIANASRLATTLPRRSYEDPALWR